MSVHASRRLLWLGLTAFAPVPILIFGTGFVPAAKLLFYAGVCAVVLLTQNRGGAVPLILLVFSLQAAVWMGLWWLVAHAATRPLQRASGRAVAGTTFALLLGIMLVPSALGLYSDPFRALPAAVATTPGNATSAAASRTELREPCDEHDPLRRPLFGDTHVHTAFSFDAWGQGTRNTPRDAYRFARGEAVGLQPFDASGRPVRSIRLRRPLDFAMVSDHAELLGETRICQTPGLDGHESLICRIARRWPMLGYAIINSQMIDDADPVRYGFCGENGAHCRAVARVPWREIQQAAEHAYDRTRACRFTSFVGFEWSGNPDSAMIHRNVVFRNDVVPPDLSNYIDDRTGENLWRWLEEACTEPGEGCDALTIPHNSNLSNGELFRVEDLGGSTDAARRRARFETLLEVTQHKGDSECRAGGNDELCDFETLPFARMREVATPWSHTTPPPMSYAREILGEGLVQQTRLGVNPFRLGLIGATDSHLGTPGLVEEDRYPGHAAGVASARLEVPPLPDDLRFNPGGLQAVWAEENSRDAIFDAMGRLETYGTSGPRMVVRLFGGWNLAEDLCDQPDFVAEGYALGVPMGGELADLERPAGAAPTFSVRALE
jgi:hypothetical protein